jgi:hypothetical protein
MDKEAISIGGLQMVVNLQNVSTDYFYNRVGRKEYFRANYLRYRTRRIDCKGTYILLSNSNFAEAWDAGPRFRGSAEQSGRLGWLNGGSLSA